MPKDQVNKPPTFLSAISTILLGIMITGFGTFVTIFINYFAFFSAGLGIVILYVGWIQWKQFQKTLPEDDTGESGETYDIEHSFGNRKTKAMYDHEYYKETLAEKRP